MPKFVFSSHIPAVVDVDVVADSLEEAKEIFREQCRNNEVKYTMDDVELIDSEIGTDFWIYDENGTVLEY